MFGGCSNLLCGSVCQFEVDILRSSRSCAGGGSSSIGGTGSGPRAEGIVLKGGVCPYEPYVGTWAPLSFSRSPSLPVLEGVEGCTGAGGRALVHPGTCDSGTTTFGAATGATEGLSPGPAEFGEIPLALSSWASEISRMHLLSLR